MRTQTQIDKILKLADSGKPYSEIAVKFNTTKNAICGLVYRERQKSFKVTKKKLPKKSIKEILHNKKRYYDLKRKKREYTEGQVLSLDTDKPFALWLCGDPHLDNNGCNIDALLKDIDAIKNKENIFGANIGDMLDNWIGRLEAQYKNSNTTQSEAIQLAEWFCNNAGINWLVHILGNHDM